jgi:hypothetical protein
MNNRLKNPIRNIRLLQVVCCIIFLAACGLSCSKTDDPVIDPPDNSTGTERKILIRYDKDNDDFYTINRIGATFGEAVYGSHNLGEWDYLAGIQTGPYFLFMHDKDKNYAIRKFDPGGQLGSETDRGTWGNTYETIMGFHVGTAGFIFGQNDGSNYWFVQHVTNEGKLGAETHNGHWNNYYKFGTPIYISGKTYLFFQTTESDNYWFIVYVSPAGELYDVCDGYWFNYWEKATSVEIGGKAFLIGERQNGTTGRGEYYIQQINSDGTMGAETDRGNWNNFYTNLVAYTSNGHAYIMGSQADASGYNPGNYFFQEVTSEGKLGTETSHGQSDRDYDFICPFTLYEYPDSFRYTVGWDLSKTTGAPARSWSPLFSNPWSGEVAMSGGVALANIDGDAGQRPDAVMAGVQVSYGAHHFYYKVAWNIESSGKATSWSETLFGPSINADQAGGGAAMTDFDGNGISDLLLMYIDDPAGTNRFRCVIGWNLGKDGKAASWTADTPVGPILGNENSGGGAAFGDIDRNGRPDLVLMGIDNPDGPNHFRYAIGKNFDNAGTPASWTSMIIGPGNIGNLSAGGGAALADINGNGKLDLVLMAIDSPTGANEFRIWVGWDVDINGNVTGWSSFKGPVPGNMTTGGGAAIGDIDKNGILDLLLMSVDDPYGID